MYTRSVRIFLRGAVHLLFALAATLVVASLAAPLARASGWPRIATSLYGLLSYFCHQMPSRTLQIFGAPMGMCSRSAPLCGAFASAGLFMVRRRRLLSWPTSILLLLPILLDTLTQSAGWRESTNLLRVLTGTLGGVGLAGLLLRGQVSAFTEGLAARQTRSSPIPLHRCLAGLLVVVLLVAGGSGVPVRAETESVSLPDGTVCKEYASAWARTVRDVPSEGQQAAAGSMFAVPLYPGLCIASPVILGVETIKVGVKTSKIRREVREKAMQECLEPSILAQRHGSEHPEVGRSLDNLATRHVALGDLLQRQATEDAAEGKRKLQAEETRRTAATLEEQAEVERAQGLELWKKADALYRRALAIREKALGPDHLDVAATLEHYAALLRRMNRATEADALDARAQAIRATREQQPEALTLSPAPQS